MVVGVACRLPRNSSRDSAAVTLCGSLFQSMTVLGKKEFLFTKIISRQQNLPLAGIELKYLLLFGTDNIAEKENTACSL